MGRIALLWVNHKVGEWTVVFVYTFIAIGCAVLFPFALFLPLIANTRNRLEIVVWRVPSLIGNAVAVSFIGLLLGELSSSERGAHCAPLTPAMSRSALSYCYEPSWPCTSQLDGHFLHRMDCGTRANGQRVLPVLDRRYR